MPTENKQQTRATSQGRRQVRDDQLALGRDIRAFRRDVAALLHGLGLSGAAGHVSPEQVDIYFSTPPKSPATILTAKSNGHCTIVAWEVRHDFKALRKLQQLVDRWFRKAHGYRMLLP